MFQNEQQFKKYISELDIDDSPRQAHRQKLWHQIKTSFVAEKNQSSANLFTRFLNVKTVAAAAVILIGLALTAIIITNLTGKHLPPRDTIAADPEQHHPSVSQNFEKLADLDFVSSLYKANDSQGLIDILKTGSKAQKILAAHYLSIIGDISAVKALNLAAKNTDTPSAKNIFTKAAETIQNRKAESSPPAEPNTPEKIQTLVPQLPAEPNKPAKKALDTPENALKVSITEKQTGQPLPDVLIKTNRDNNKNQYKTDEMGTAYIDLGQNKTNYMSLNFSKPSFVPMHISWRVKQGFTIPEHFELKLQKGTKIGGTVLNQANEPIEGATVFVNAPVHENTPGQLYVRISDHPVKTDAQGKWMCDILPQNPAEYNLALKFSHPDYADDKTYRWQGNLPPLEKLRDMTAVFYMKKGFDVSGCVYDQNGAPIAGASVTTGGSRYSDSPKTATNQDGKFIFKNAKPGLMILTVQAKGFAPDIARFQAAPDNCIIDFYLEPGRTIKARVIDTEGNPIAAVHFNPDQWRGFRTLSHRGATDKNGEFIWKDAPADEVMMDFYKQGYMSERDVPMTASPDIYEVVMYPWLNISGTVTDAETGKPIQNFTIQKGIKWNNNDNIHWQDGYGNVLEFKNGSYSVPFSYPYPGHLLKVEAKGYLTAQSDIFDSYEGNVKYDFQLQKGSFQLDALVLLPDGITPAKKAKVYLSTPGNNIQMQNGYVRHSSGVSDFLTNQKGIFTLNPQSENYLILAVHQKGFAWVKADHFEQEPVIVLEKWGKVEGTLYVGSQLGVDQNISLYPEIKWTHQPDEPRFHAYYKTVTDRNGEFILNRVIPGPAKISRIKIVDMGTSRINTPLLSKSIEVLPDQTTEVVLGGTGIAIEGLLMPPLGVEDLNWTMADVSITTKVDVEQFNQSENQYPEPENFDSMTYEQVIQWYRKWHQSPEGKEFIENINQKHKQKAATQRKHFSVPIEHDGSFHMDDIPPGEYQFTVNVYASNERGNRDYRNIRAKLNFDLTIPQYSQTNDEILDLGSLQLIDPKTEVLKIGKRAPALKAQTLSGNNFNLAGCRGKYVLLYLWSPPHLPGETDQKNIPQILKNTLRLCRKNNITCAGMVPNADNDLSRKILNKYIDQYAVKSDQLIITHQQVRQWTGTYTSYEGYYLIDPEGIIIKTGKDLANMPAAITDNIDMLN